MTEKPLPELIFPCEYLVKVIGLDEDNFTQFVIDVISRHVPGLSPDSFIAHASSQGKYLSITVTFIAESRTQVDALYEELGLHKRVLMAF